jgi:hypothetical protein
MHDVFTDDDGTYVLDIVQELHDMNPADLHFAFHTDDDGVLHLVNRDPIVALMQQVVAPTHTRAMHASLTPCLVTFAGLPGRRYCTECLPRRSMLFETITDFDVALTTNSLVIARALTPVRPHLRELAAAQTTLTKVDALATFYAELTAKVGEELDHLADPASFPCGPILVEAYQGVYARLGEIHEATIGSLPVRAVLERHARPHHDGSSDDVLVELGALSADDRLVDKPRRDTDRLAYCLQSSFAPGTLDHDLPVVVPRWVADTIGATAGQRMRSPVFADLTPSEIDTAVRLWDPHGSALYRSLERCVNAAVALR